jgi:hypothetical protein
VSVYLLSAQPSFIDLVKAAFVTDNPKVFSASGLVLAELLGGSRSKWEVVIVDVGSVSDARHLLDFIKSSAPLRAVRVMLVGTAAQLAAMGEVPGGSADATVQAPFTGAQIAAAVTKLRQETGPAPGGIIPPRAQL